MSLPEALEPLVDYYRAVFIRNLNEFSLSSCEVRLPSNVVLKLKRNLLGKEELKVPFKDFRPDARATDPLDGVRDPRGLLAGGARASPARA